MTRDEVLKRIPSTWHDKEGIVDALHQRLEHETPYLLENWIAKTWAKNPKFYQANRERVTSALQAGRVFDDSEAPLPFPKVTA